MNRQKRFAGTSMVARAWVLGWALAAWALAGAAAGQTVAPPHHAPVAAMSSASHAAGVGDQRDRAAVAVVHLLGRHRRRATSGHARQVIEITGVNAGVVVVEQTATTTIDIALKNLTNARQEAEVLLPVPPGAVVRSFTFEGAAAEPTAELLPKDAAKTAYESIVAKVKDPALLEFAGYNLIRSSVFPLDPNGTQKVRLTYESLLAADGNRVDYELPRSESVEYAVPWTFSMKIKAKRPVATVYSPTHALEVSPHRRQHRGRPRGA